MAFIELTGVVKAYDANVILKGIDLAIGRGEFLVLVGPSGCGKSTLLRCIAGLETITSGDLFIDGARANDTPPKQRDLAMVFQSYALYPHLTVRENLGFSLSVRKTPKSEIAARVEAAAARLGLEALLDRLPKQLSGGQRQRVAVGRAIVRQPNAFLFDEPLSNLDAALRSHMRLELKKLHRELATTMIYVTHDQVEAMTLADRIVVLAGGVIQQVGTPDQLYRTPTNKFVAHFIGSPPMNFWPGTFDRDRVRVSGAGFDLPLPEAYRNLPAGDVWVGVRPHHLTRDANRGGRVTATVDVLEPVGGESYVHARVGGVETIAQVDTDVALGIAPDTELTFRVDPADVRLFDHATGVALAPTG